MMKFRVTSFLSSRSQSVYSYTLKNLFSSTSYKSRLSKSGGFEPKYPVQGRSIYQRISPLNDSDPIVPVLDSWIQQGNDVGREDLQYIIKQLDLFKRFNHALQVSQWMTDKRSIALSPLDVSLRLRFICHVQGLEKAERYFDNIPEELRNHLACNALLSCYCDSKCVEKAECFMQIIRNMGYDKGPMPYTILMRLYNELRDYEKVKRLAQEMEQKNLVPDKSVYTFQLSAYAAASDSDTIEKIVEKMESDPLIAMDATVYNIVAGAYVNLGLHEKAVEILGKLEKVLPMVRDMVGKSTQYHFLIESYGKLGKKDDVLRIWNLYQTEQKIEKKSPLSMLKTLVKFDDTEEEIVKIVKEWESKAKKYDFEIANFLIRVYCRSGEIKKAEDVLNNGIARKGTPRFSTYLIFADAYVKNNQFDKVVEALENANSICRERWKEKDMLVNCLKLFKEGDIKRAETEELIELLKVEGFYYVKVGDKVRDLVNAEKLLP